MLYYLNQYISKTLETTGGIDNSQTTDIELPDVTGIDYSKPGIAVISYSDPLDTDAAEWITYTSINDTTKKFVGVTRGQEGYSAKAHAKGVTIAFPLSESHINNLNDALSIDGVATNGVTQTSSTPNAVSAIATEIPTTEYVGKQTSVASDATPNPTGDAKTNEYYLTALAAAAEFAAPSGTPVDGNVLRIRVLDDGTGRGLTWNAIYLGVSGTLPSTTTASKYMYIGFIYSSADSKWHMVAQVEES